MKREIGCKFAGTSISVWQDTQTEGRKEARREAWDAISHDGQNCANGVRARVNAALRYSTLPS